MQPTNPQLDPVEAADTFDNSSTWRDSGERERDRKATTRLLLSPPPRQLFLSSPFVSSRSRYCPMPDTRSGQLSRGASCSCWAPAASSRHRRQEESGWTDRDARGRMSLLLVGGASSTGSKCAGLLRGTPLGVGEALSTGSRSSLTSPRTPRRQAFFDTGDQHPTSIVYDHQMGAAPAGSRRNGPPHRDGASGRPSSAFWGSRSPPSLPRTYYQRTCSFPSHLSQPFPHRNPAFPSATSTAPGRP